MSEDSRRRAIHADFGRPGPEFALVECMHRWQGGGCNETARIEDSAQFSTDGLRQLFERMGWTISPTRCPNHLYRVERYDPGWGGFRNDDLTPHNLTLMQARVRAKGDSRGTRQPLRVVNEKSGDVVVGYRLGKTLRLGDATDWTQRARVAGR